MAEDSEIGCGQEPGVIIRGGFAGALFVVGMALIVKSELDARAKLEAQAP